MTYEGKFRIALGEYEKLLYDAYSKGQFDNAELTKTWTFFNSMFFCGTIYTTIGKSSERNIGQLWKLGWIGGKFSTQNPS